MKSGTENKLHKGDKRVLSAAAPAGELIRSDGINSDKSTPNHHLFNEPPTSSYIYDTSPSRVRADQLHPTVVTVPLSTMSSSGNNSGDATGGHKRKTSLSAIFGMGGGSPSNNQRSTTTSSSSPRSPPSIGLGGGNGQGQQGSLPGSGAGAQYGYEDPESLHLRLKEEARERAKRTSSAPNSPTSASGRTHNKRTSGVSSGAESFGPGSASGNNAGWYTTNSQLPNSSSSTTSNTLGSSASPLAGTGAPGASSQTRTGAPSQYASGSVPIPAVGMASGGGASDFATGGENRSGKYESLYHAAGLDPSAPVSTTTRDPSARAPALVSALAPNSAQQHPVSMVPLPASITNAGNTAQHRRRISRDDFLATQNQNQNQMQQQTYGTSMGQDAPRLPFPDMGKSPSQFALAANVDSGSDNTIARDPISGQSYGRLPGNTGDQLPASEIARQRAMLPSTQSTGSPAGDANAAAPITSSRTISHQTQGPAQQLVSQGSPKIISTTHQRYLEDPIPTISHPAPDHPMRDSLFHNIAAPIPHYMFVSYSASVCMECVQSEQRMHAIRAGGNGEKWKYIYKDPEQMKEIKSDDPNTRKVGREEYQDTVSLGGAAGADKEPCQCKECLNNRSIVKYAAENGLIEKIFESRRHPLSETIETTTYTTIIRAPIIQETITTVWCEEPNCPECALKQKEYEESELRNLLDRFEGMVVHQTGGSDRYEGYKNLWGTKEKKQALGLSTNSATTAGSGGNAGGSSSNFPNIGGGDLKALLSIAGNPRQEAARQQLAGTSEGRGRASVSDGLVQDRELGTYEIRDGIPIQYIPAASPASVYEDTIMQ